MMTSNEYARKVAELIDARPRHIDLDKLLHEIYVLAKIAESRRAQKEGRWITNDQMREKLRKKFSLEPTERNGREKISKTVEYAQKIVEHIKARPRGVKLDQLLDEISFHAEIAESEREIKAGRWSTPEQVMERMWKLIYSKFNHFKELNHLNPKQLKNPANNKPPIDKNSSAALYPLKN